MAAGVAVFAAGCTKVELAPHLRPLSKESMMLLGKKGMDPSQPIFIRIFKEESELEIWKQRADGHFYLFKSYPICAWSGTLGPKLQQGDKQAPEGFYRVARTQMNPNSQFFLSFNLGYPNAYDRAHGRTGDALMVHGKCTSAGCYAMTDALMEEIYALARDAFSGGQETIHVHAFPFRMTDANMARHKDNKWAPFWRTLKEGYDHFEYARRTPEVAVCARRYNVNVTLSPNLRLDPEGACPRFDKPAVTAFTPLPVPAAPQTRLADDATVRAAPKPTQATGPVDWTTQSGLINAR
jgi:murein L,D-transpeptidase YafK